MIILVFLECVALFARDGLELSLADTRGKGTPPCDYYSLVSTIMTAIL